MAVPVTVKGEHIATIFCGQGRSWLEEGEIRGRQLALQVEEAVGFRFGQLAVLRENAPMLSEIADMDEEPGIRKTAQQSLKRIMELKPQAET